MRCGRLTPARHCSTRSITPFPVHFPSVPPLSPSLIASSLHAATLPSSLSAACALSLPSAAKLQSVTPSSPYPTAAVLLPASASLSSSRSSCRLRRPSSPTLCQPLRSPIQYSGISRSPSESVAHSLSASSSPSWSLVVSSMLFALFSCFSCSVSAFLADTYMYLCCGQMAIAQLIRKEELLNLSEISKA